MRRVCLVVALGLSGVACAALAGLDEPDESAADGGIETGAPARDTGTTSPDATVDSGPETASFEILCNGTALPRHTCAKKRWEFDLCEQSPERTVVLFNTGELPIAYIARRSWGAGQYLPSIPNDGKANEITGIVAPKARVELSSAYNGGTFAIVGSTRPFDSRSRTETLSDEGTVPWTKGDLAGTPATQLDVAQLTAPGGADPQCWNIENPDRKHFD